MTSPQFFLCVPYSFQSLNPTSIQRGPPDGRVTRVDIAYVRRISQDVPRPFPLAEKKKGDREEKQSYGQLKVEGEERGKIWVGPGRKIPPLFFLPLVHALMTVVKRREEGKGARIKSGRPGDGIRQSARRLNVTLKAMILYIWVIVRPFLSE